MPLYFDSISQKITEITSSTHPYIVKTDNDTYLIKATESLLESLIEDPKTREKSYWPLSINCLLEPKKTNTFFNKGILKTSAFTKKELTKYLGDTIINTAPKQFNLALAKKNTSDCMHHVDNINEQEFSDEETANKTDDWHKIIPNFRSLYDLFLQPLQYITFQDRKEILAGVSLRLNELIQNGYDLQRLFNLDLHRLNKDQRQTIWQSVKTRLNALIKNFNQLQELLKLSLIQLDNIQRHHIWLSIQPKLRSLIKTQDELFNLLQLPITHFNEKQRKTIIEITEDILENLDEHDQERFLSLSEEQFPDIGREKLNFNKSMRLNKP